jgi:LacI family transcriptional regulator
LPPTLRDVALKAGVSSKTASRVVNRQEEVSDETRKRVQAAIEELGYRPSKLARGLVTRRTDTIGLVLGDISNPFFPEVARGVLDDAEQAGYNVFVCNSDGDPEREFRTVHSLTDHAVDGIIFFASLEAEDFLMSFAGPDRPVVCVNRPFESLWISRVMMQSRAGAQIATEYLINKGHTKVGMLGGPAVPATRHERARGYLDTLAGHGLPAREDWIISGPPILEQGHRGARELLTQHPEITAIFAYNDLLALGAIQACDELGRRVLEDCAVIGFDDIPLADRVSPKLTTIRVDKYALGQMCMQRMIEMLSSPGAVFPPAEVGVELVVRESA